MSGKNETTLCHAAVSIIISALWRDLNYLLPGPINGPGRARMIAKDLVPRVRSVCPSEEDFGKKLRSRNRFRGGESSSGNEKLMLITASYTRSRSAGFLARTRGAIMVTVVYYKADSSEEAVCSRPPVSWPTLFPIVHLFHLHRSMRNHVGTPNRSRP